MEPSDVPTSTHECTLVDRDLRELVRSGALTCVGASDDGLLEFVQPASIDIPVGDVAYLVKGTFLPFCQRVRSLLPEMTLETRSLAGEGAVLLKGQTYLVYIGRVDLPPGHRGCLSPKSSIGRIDLLVRCLVDGCGLYDTVPARGGRAGGAAGTVVDDGDRGNELWVEISPRSFNIRLQAGSPLTQLMVLRDVRYTSAAEASSSGGGDGGSALVPAAAMPVCPPVNVVFDASGVPIAPSWYKNCLVLSLRVPTTPGVLVGFEAVATHDVIDLAMVDGHNASAFFRPMVVDETTQPLGRLTLVKVSAPRLPLQLYCISSSESFSRGDSLLSSPYHIALSSSPCRPRLASPLLTLLKDRFYILCTKERVAVPPWLSAEMTPFSHLVGELRAHYAGFFDPGFGFGADGALCGTVGVLEVRSPAIVASVVCSLSTTHGSHCVTHSVVQYFDKNGSLLFDSLLSLTSFSFFSFVSRCDRTKQSPSTTASRSQ